MQLLPLGKQTFFDNDGVPLASGKVYFYLPGTNVLSHTWPSSDPNGKPNPNPVVLDGSGEAVIWGNRSLRQVVTDANDNPIWDEEVAASISSDELAAPNGSALVGYLKDGTGAALRSVEDELRDGNYKPFQFGATGTDLTSALATALAAVNDAGGGIIELPGGSFTLSTSLAVPPDTVLRGKGIGVSNLRYTGSGFAFSTLNPNGSTEVGAPRYFDFSLTTSDSGIQLNSPTGGFTDGPTSQAYMLRHHIQRVALIAGTSGVGTAIQYSKAFDGSILQCLISGFAVGIDSYGSDLCAIEMANRIRGCVTSIRIASEGTFGSQTTIRHNDLLSSAGDAFIDSSDRCLIVKENYFEQIGGLIETAIRVHGGYTCVIRDNRIEIPASFVTNWLTLSVDMLNLDIENNTTSGPQYGAALFPATGSKYWYNVLIRQRIRNGGNSNPAGIPFNSTEQTFAGGRNLSFITPDTPGLLSQAYGSSLYVKEKAFVLPVGAAIAYFDTQANGTAEAALLARTDDATGSMVLSYQLQNADGTVLTNGTVTAVGSYAFLALGPARVFAGLKILLFATTSNNSGKDGSIFIRKLTVDDAD